MVQCDAVAEWNKVVELARRSSVSGLNLERLFHDRFLPHFLGNL